MPGRSRIARGAQAALVTLMMAGTAHALDSEGARTEVRQTLSAVRADMAALRSKLDAKPRVSHPPEQLIAVGELSLRTKDYDQAIDTFNQVVELYRQGKAGPNAHADGLYLLGDAYFEAGQLLSARRQYSELLDLANQSPYDSYAGRSLARLVDVALHTGRLESLDTLRQQAARVSASDPSGSLDYARGKLEFARGNFGEARNVLAGVAATSAYYHQSQYVLGAMLAKQATADAGAGLTDEARARLVVPASAERFASAITQFKKVTELPADTAAHRNVIDLAWLAIGRLHYESDAYLDSAEAYIKVDRESAVYYEMLYELAWVYIRVGDYQRAERALELLAVAAPDTLDVADSALLRADLMLRSGRYERALDAYAEVRDRFDPIRERVDEFLTTTSDPAIYYDRLVEEGMAIGGANLPDLVLDWVREEARGERVFAVIDDVTEAREVLRRARRLASKLNAVLGSPSRARAFPDLKAGLEKTLGLINQIAQARRVLALGLDDVDDAKFSGELGQLRAERRALMARLGTVPVSSSDFLRREEQGNRNWNKASQALQRVTLEADKLQAVINGLTQVLQDPDQHGVTRDSASRMRFQAEIEANQQDLAVYRERIEAYREDIETGRVQVGFGDRRFVEDERVRDRFREIFERELAVLIEQQPSEAAADYARSLVPILADARALEERLSETAAALQSQVAEGAERLRQLVSEESERIEAFTQQLDALDQHARLLVGEVAMKNFSNVRDRLKGIVLRADVGIVQQAWELREEQQLRLRDLQRQRALEEQNLDDELREVIDDAGDGQ